MIHSWVSEIHSTMGMIQSPVLQAQKSQLNGWRGGGGGGLIC
jgi:hypothetical protein